MLSICGNVREFLFMKLAKAKSFTSLVAREPALISGFCSVKRMRVFDSPWKEH